MTEAYEVLSDDTKKANYDQFGHAGPTKASAVWWRFRWDGFGFEEYFQLVFRWRHRRRQDPNAPRKGMTFNIP